MSITSTPQHTTAFVGSGYSVAQTSTEDSLSTPVFAKRSTESTVNFPSSEQPMSIVAARKLALLQKLGGGATASTAAPAASEKPSLDIPKRDWNDIGWMRKDREGGDGNSIAIATPMETWRRRDSIATNPPTLGTLSAQLTGSTVVDEALRPRPTLLSTGHRVKLAIMAFSQLDVNDSNKSGETVRVGDRGIRPWSRMSSSTARTRVESGDISGLALIPDDCDSSEEMQSLRHSRSFSEVPSPSKRSSFFAPEDDFDTHPPTMKSPRTKLAHVIAPPKLRTSPVYIRGGGVDTSLEVDDVSETEEESGGVDIDMTLVGDMIPADPAEATPTLLTVKETVQVTHRPRKSRARALRPTNPPALATPKTGPRARRHTSLANRTLTIPRKARPSEPTPTASTKQPRPPPKASNLPPLPIKPRNNIGLRKSDRPAALKPFKTSAKSWAPGLVSGVATRYIEC